MGMQRVGHDEWLSLQYPLLYFSNLGRSNLSYYLNSLLDLGRVVDFQFFSIFYLIAGHSNDFQAPYMLEWTLYTCSSFFPQLWLSKKRVDALTWRWCHHLSKKAHTGPRKEEDLSFIVPGKRDKQKVIDWDMRQEMSGYSKLNQDHQ